MQDKSKAYTDLLKQNGMEYSEISPEEIDRYKHEWFERFVPPQLREEAINCYCFNKDGYCGYLWHAFSYELLSCDKGEDAVARLNEIDRCEAILLANIDDVAFRIKDASKLLAKDIDELLDVLLTDCDFNWTYAKTHESELGPYFYRH